jgi:hypothetical protein
VGVREVRLAKVSGDRSYHDSEEEAISYCWMVLERRLSIAEGVASDKRKDLNEFNVKHGSPKVQAVLPKQA